MTVEIRLTVSQATLDAYDEIRLERAAVSDGFLAAGASQIAAIPLVNGHLSYIHYDLSGAPLSWYRTRFATALPAYSAYTAAFQGILPPLVSMETALEALDMSADSPKVGLVRILLDAISARIRSVTGRMLEGSPTTWDEIYRLNGGELWLRGVPIASIASIRRVAFDGTEDDPYEATSWRLENPASGHIRLRGLWERWAREMVEMPPYVRVVYTTTGVVGPQFVMATIEWLKARWEDFSRDRALASYSTGSDSESYNTAVAGKTPYSVAAELAGLSHLTGTGGGPI